MRRRDPAAKRRAILDAAVEELATKGYHGANTAVIAAKAGVSVGTIFNLFETKEQLANEVFRDCKAKYDERLPAIFAAEVPVREQFHRLCQAFFAMYFETPHHFVFYENHVHNHFLDQTSLDARQGLRDDVHRWVRHHQDAGVLKPYPAELLRATVMGSFSRLVREALDESLRLSKRLTEDLETLLWEAIAVTPRP